MCGLRALCDRENLLRIADGLRGLSAELGLGEVRGRGLLLALEQGTDDDRG